MNTECVVPDWLHDIILGYGDPGSAHYSKMPNQISTLDFNDTFLSLDHLRSCFPGNTIKVTEENPELQVPPFRWILKEKCFVWSILIRICLRNHIYIIVYILLNVIIHHIYPSYSLFCCIRITFPTSNTADKGKKRKADEEVENKEEDKTLIVEPYVTPNRGPYPYNQPKRWEINTRTFPIII